MPKYSSAEIEKRNAFSQKMFSQLEDNMEKFLDYVPIDEDHLKVFSPKLITLILDAGPELISAFDIAINCIPTWEYFQPEFTIERESLWKKEQEGRKHNRSLTFNDYTNFLERYSFLKLSTKTVQLIELDAYFKPFELSATTSWASVDWWSTYNLLKHDKYSNRKKATLISALKLLGALLCILENNSWLISHTSLQSGIFQPTGSLLDPSFKKI
ncbi:MAG: hypothetical protein ABSC20_02615 [Candidatus Bathyarchaeia archaeon]|jgi:hypothetical protein